MNRLFRILASCVFAAVIAFGSVVGGAFAATTPNPANFPLGPGDVKLVEFNPQQSSFTVLYSTTNFQPATITFLGGSCTDTTVQVPSASVDFPKTYSCGQISLGRFTNN
ncbi:hypothetical protein [Dolichospermum circinale]|uniref:hypothetical protein n=1 Tax=Dolichospermum circinale TaxID=109265 RepID=UPI00232E212D|nr:hypothetical protein [Dolichospermum circinale]MDB9452286.1 hypothetical protein [Dolichospermum circinale CS-547]